MAHELSQNENGRYEFFYCGEKPWHGLGQKLDNPATAEEAIKAANLGWAVSRRELITTCGVDIAGHKAIVRDDNNRVLSVMTNSYRPIQNSEAFAFFDSVVGTGGAYYETAGAIFDGRKIFLIAKLPGELTAGKEDKIEQYLTLVNSHDGSQALKMYFTPIRVVCNNTLMASLRNRQESISIRHFGDVNTKIKQAQNALGLAHRYYADFQAIVDRLVQIKTDSQMVDDFLHKLFKVEEGEKPHFYVQKGLDKVLEDFESDPKNNLPGMERTAWSLYNAAAQYADHESKSVGGEADHRMASIMFNSAAKFKQRALDSILEIAN